MSDDVTPALGAPSNAVVITGAASGIGHGCARALAAVGRPVAIWDLHQSQAEDAAARIAAEFGVTALGFGVDVRDLAAIAESGQRTLAALPAVGGLVHCAGIVDTGGLEGVTESAWNDGIAVHLRAIPFFIKAFLPSLKAQPGSAIVATASINATLGNAKNPIYTAGKGGVLSLVRSLADDLAPHGIRINSVSPGAILTPMLRPVVEAAPGYFERRILLERLGAPEEIGRVVRFLLSDEASYITASEVIVDGGNLSSQR